MLLTSIQIGYLSTTLLLLFKCAYHWKRPLISTANEALVGTFMIIGDVNDVDVDSKIACSSDIVRPEPTNRTTPIDSTIAYFTDIMRRHPRMEQPEVFVNHFLWPKKFCA